jgi:hypothetical protein
VSEKIIFITHLFDPFISSPFTITMKKVVCLICYDTGVVCWINFDELSDAAEFGSLIMTALLDFIVINFLKLE